RRLAEEVINLERTLEFDPPSEATELRLAQIRLRRLRRQADQALDALRDQARGILRKEAGKFTPHKKGSRSGELAADYASAAEEGFLIAHRTWDPSKGSFSTWLVMKLKKALQKEVARLERGGVSLHTFYAEAAVRAVEREAA